MSKVWVGILGLFCIGKAEMRKVEEKVKVQQEILKKELSNGMTILVRPVHTVPKVSIQLWYDVGSKDEKDKERGIAHLIEHMIFKGTQKLSESDINVITHMLSGSTNAFTSYDYTGYLFNLPSHHWQEAFSIMADCMTNCTFKEQHLSSEMKAVIQELKMYKDHYVRSLVDEMIGIIFQDHPYHHPIIGYKQDLWSVHSEDLKKFYKKHYVPNNATLIVVGDVNPEEVFLLAEEKFGHTPSESTYKKHDFYFNQDISSKTVTLYRDIQQPTVVYAFLVPGIKSKKDHILELAARILGKGKGSRLYKKIVDEKHLAHAISASSEELFDYGLFFIVVEPKNIADIAAIEKIIIQEIESLVSQGFSDAELDRAIKKTEMMLYSTMENFEHQAYEIGKYYLATKDETYLFHCLNKTKEELRKEVEQAIKKYLRPTLMHKGMVLPIPETEKLAWIGLQEESDKEDNRILSARTRTDPIEPPAYAKSIQIKNGNPFKFPKPEVYIAPNGLKVLYYDNQNTPKIDLILDLKAKHYFDPDGKEGLGQFVSKMLMEGTENYTAQQFIDAIESRGMSIAPYPGGIAMSLLSEDLPFALQMLHEILTRATFNKKEIEKVRAQLIGKLKNFWDEPRSFAGQLIRERVYENHPYRKNSLGSIESIQNIGQGDLVDYYTNFIVPDGARLAIVGDLSKYDTKAEVIKALGDWNGPKIPTINFPLLKELQGQEINHPINRDQVVLRLGGLSIDRKHQNFDKLLLFDQIFSGGALGSLSSRLFQLREQSGLFYTIGGSLIAGADEQPGMVLVQTIVSLDRLHEAENAIRKTMLETPDTITQDEFEEAKRAVINAQIDNFSSNYNMAHSFLFLDRYQFPINYFDKRIESLNRITREEMAQAAKQVLASNLVTLRVGRLNKTQVV